MSFTSPGRTPVAVVAAAVPWVYALGWMALGWRLRLDGVAVASVSPSAVDVVGVLLASAALFVAVRSAWFARRARPVAWAGLVVTIAMIVGTVVRPPRSSLVHAGAMEVLVDGFCDADWCPEGSLDADAVAAEALARRPESASVRWRDPTTESRRAWALGPFTLARASQSGPGEGLVLRGPGLPPAGAALPHCLTFADAGLRVILYDDPARDRWFVVCDGSDSHHETTMLGERSAHSQPVIQLVHRFILHRLGGRAVPSDPGLDAVRRTQRGALAVATIGVLLALARIAPWRRAWSAHEHAWALTVLWLATAPLVMTWAFVWSR